MSLTSIMSSASSGLMTAQTGLRVVSDNIANVNTAGYSRKVVDQSSLTSGGLGVGVDVSRIRRVADQFLQKAALGATATAGRASVTQEVLDRAQAQYGDPSTETSFFNRLDDIYSSFAAAAEDPTSTIRRSQALNNVDTFLTDASRIGDALRGMQGEVDTRIGSTIERVNALLEQITALNGQIAHAAGSARDTSGSENVQSQLIDELATLVDINISARPQGGINIRTSEGQQLVGDWGAGRFDFVRPTGGQGEIRLTLPGASEGQATVRPRLASGELRGLLDLRDTELPALNEELSEFVTRAVDELNRAHNANSAAPAPASLTGRNTGLDLPTAVSGFTGLTTVVVVDAAGVLQRSVDIDFDAMTLSVDGGAASAFTTTNFLTDLNTALGAMGSASFSNGALTLAASSGGIAVVDDAANPSMKAGKGFSHFFGLNDLAGSSQYAFYETGLSVTDAHGFTPGDAITFRMTDDEGRIRDVSVVVPPAGTMQDLLDSLNANAGGLGFYGNFALDAEGEMGFTPVNSGLSLSVYTDDTQRGAGGPSISQLFGIGSAQRATRSESFSVRSALAADPTRLALAQVDLSQAAGGYPVLTRGDGRGAGLVATSGDAAAGFDTAGSMTASTMTVLRYGAEMSGSIARKASMAETTARGADAVSNEAVARRQSAEGVNLDEELISLTTYQQAFNASARLIQASKDLFDTLMTMI